MGSQPYRIGPASSDLFGVQRSKSYYHEKVAFFSWWEAAEIAIVVMAGDPEGMIVDELAQTIQIVGLGFGFRT